MIKKQLLLIIKLRTWLSENRKHTHTISFIISLANKRAQLYVSHFRGRSFLQQLKIHILDR